MVSCPRPLARVLNRILVRDCLSFMASLPAGCIDVIVTSPPYNIGKKYSSYFDSLSREAYLDWMDEVARAAKRVLAQDGSFFLNIGGKPSNAALPYDVCERFRRHFFLQNDIQWVKSISIPEGATSSTGGLAEGVSVGHFKPINSKRFLNSVHESVFHFTKRGDVPLDKLSIGVPYQDKSNVLRWRGKRDLRDRGDAWFIPYDTINSHRLHPASFPTRLPEMCILLHGVRKGMVAYDPFMGTGSTALACLRLGVDFIGTEIDSEYVRIAEEKIRSERIRLRLINGGKGLSRNALLRK